MIPNFELAQWIHDTMRKGLSDDNPHPIYVDINGNRRPLARYYTQKAFIYTPLDAMDFWFNGNPDKERPSCNLTPDQKDEKYRQFSRRLQAVDKKGDFDLLSTAMSEHLFGDPDGAPGTSHVRDFSGGTVYHLGTNTL